MIDLSLTEAQLLRVLTSFFGRDQVVVRLSVLTVCGGMLPAGYSNGLEELSGAELQGWASRNKCLFTITDPQGNPRLVFEFAEGFSEVVDLQELQYTRFLPPLLQAAGIRYVTMTKAELSEMLDPDGALDFFTFLRDKVAQSDAAA